MSDKNFRHINHKTNKFFSKKKKSKLNTGFIVAMSICLVAIGAASWSTYKSIDEYVNPSNEGDNTSSQALENPPDNMNANHNMSGIIDTQSQIINLLPQTDITLSDTDETLDSSSSQFVTSDSQVLTTESDTYTPIENQGDLVSTRYLFPAGQNVTKPYSGDTPVYSETMGDWRAHLGTDFYAEKGTKITPLTTGVVTEIYTDGLLGVTVVIDHGNDVVAYYSGLGTTTLVNVGDSVGVGDYIGSVNTVPSESLDEPHLHLAVQIGGSWVDPMDILEG